MITIGETHVLTLAIIVAWLALGIRFLYALFRTPLRQRALAGGLDMKWSIWGLAFFVVLAGTTYHPVVSTFFERIGGEWIEPIPRMACAVAAYMIGAHVSSRFLPTYQLPRTPWYLMAGVLTITAYTLILRAGIDRVHLWTRTLADPLFHFYILLTTLRINWPAFAWLRAQEENLPMRVRLILLSGMCVFICIWMVSDIAAALLTALGVPSAFLLPIRPFRVAGVAITFVLAFFAPASVYRWMAEIARYVSLLARYALMHRIEHTICCWTSQCGNNASFHEALKNPELAVYRSAIAILDARKLLKLFPQDTEPRLLAERLELAAQPELQFADVTMRLSRIGRDYLWHSVRG